LTALEHVYLYARLKGIPNNKIETLAFERLNEVRLWNVKDKVAGTYSGGMKRRLSLIIATIGDPKVSFYKKMRQDNMTKSDDETSQIDLIIDE